MKLVVVGIRVLMTEIFQIDDIIILPVCFHAAALYQNEGMEQ